MTEELKEIFNVLEKIAKELEIANKLKFYELILSQPNLSFKYLLKFYEKSSDLEKEIKSKLEK